MSRTFAGFCRTCGDDISNSPCECMRRHMEDMILYNECEVEQDFPEQNPWPHIMDESFGTPKMLGRINTPPPEGMFLEKDAVAKEEQKGYGAISDLILMLEPKVKTGQNETSPTRKTKNRKGKTSPPLITKINKDKASSEPKPKNRKKEIYPQEVIDKGRGHGFTEEMLSGKNWRMDTMIVLLCHLKQYQLDHPGVNVDDVAAQFDEGLGKDFGIQRKTFYDHMRNFRIAKEEGLLATALDKGPTTADLLDVIRERIPEEKGKPGRPKGESTAKIRQDLAFLNDLAEELRILMC